MPNLEHKEYSRCADPDMQERVILTKIEQAPARPETVLILHTAQFWAREPDETNSIADG